MYAYTKVHVLLFFKPSVSIAEGGLKIRKKKLQKVRYV